MIEPFFFGTAERLFGASIQPMLLSTLWAAWNGLRKVLGEDQATGLVTLFEEQLVDIAHCLQ